MQKKHNILICSGGTGGHMLPAMRLGDLLIKEDHHVIFSGMGLSKNPYFEKEKFIYFDIPSSPVKIFRPFKMLSRWIRGLIKSFFLMRRFKPKIVVGFGSFHTFPLLLCAKILKIRYVLFEANVSVGKVNRLFLKKANKVATLFSDEKNMRIVDLNILTYHMKTMPKDEAKERLHLNKDVFTLLVFGGSQGASFINEIVGKLAEKYQKSLQIIHITGSEIEKEKMQKIYKSKKISSYVAVFEKNMSLIYSAADLAITRAGGATMAELVYFLLPSIMIPYPFASEDHQKENALFFQNVIGGGKCFSQNEIKPDLLLQTIENLSQNDQLKKLKKNLLFYKEKRKNMKEIPLHKLIYQSLKEENNYG